MYIPNPKKWIQFYDTIGKQKYNPSANLKKQAYNNQVGGSLTGTSKPFMIPVGTMSANKADLSKDVKVKLVSTSEQFLEQAKEEVGDTHGLKRKGSKQIIHSIKQPQQSKTKLSKEKSKPRKNPRSAKQTKSGLPQKSKVIYKDILNKK